VTWPTSRAGSESVFDLTRHLFNRVVSNFWVYGQRKNARLVGVSSGKILWTVTEISVGRIKRERFRIVQSCVDTRLGETLSQSIPVFCANDVEVIDMVAVRPDLWRDNFIYVLQKPAVKRSDTTARVSPGG